MKLNKPAVIHILKILSFLLVPLFVYLCIVNSSIAAINPSVTNYAPSDEETNYLTALSVYRGEGLYQNFSISYPPGRFLAQALFFRLTGPTVISARIYMNLFAPLLFPTLLFLLTFILLRRLMLQFIPAYLLSWFAALLDITLVHSEQEVHVVMAAFLLVLISKLLLRDFLLGLLLGLIFLFRFEAGIIVTLSLLLSYRSLPKRQAIYGSLLVWAPVIINLLLHASLFNFLYDTLVLGLITQPRTMGQAIPPNALWFVFLSSLILVFSFSLSLWQRGDKHLKVIASVALLSFISALGRSDEGHLWYALLWLPLLISYAIAQLGRTRLLPTIYSGIVLYLASYLVITVKSPGIFLFIGSLALIIASRFAKYSRELIVGGLIAALLSFHSYKYFTLRLQIPHFVGSIASPWSYPISKDSIGGLNFPDSTLNTLAELKSHITGPNPSLFIFPENTIYYEYFDLPRPTRYLYLTGERTAYTESTIIADLESSPNLYILVFPDKAEQRGGEVWSWIEQHSRVVSRSSLQNNPIELRHVD